jgi:chaperonin cofactor prefoldin
MTKYQRSTIKTSINNIKSKVSEINGIDSFLKDENFESYTVRLTQEIFFQTQIMMRVLLNSNSKYSSVIAKIHEVKTALDEIEKSLQEEF